MNKPITLVKLTPILKPNPWLENNPNWVICNPVFFGECVCVCLCGSQCNLFLILISSPLGPLDLAFIMLTCSNRSDFCHFCFVLIYHYALTRFVTQIVISSQWPQRLAPFSFPNSDWYFSFVSRS